MEDWNGIIRLRRMLGLYCFYYATLHALIYLLFDAALQWQWIVGDLREKPYIIAGVLAFLMLIPLAVTSHTGLLKRMGKRRWQGRWNAMIFSVIPFVVVPARLPLSAAR